MPVRYDPILVLMSAVVAVLASYTALSMAGRVSEPYGRVRPAWLFGAACAQGIGIWSMHFTGMLALRVPVDIAYDLPLITLSAVVSIAGSLAALSVAGRGEQRPATLLAGGL